MRSSPGVEMLARFLRAREGVTTMAAEIEYESGWLRRGGWCRWRLAVTLACVLAGVLWAAGPASAASRKWTVLNHTFHDLRLEEVTHVRGAPFGFEGRPEKGSFLDAARPDVLSKHEPPTQQHFELKWGPDYEAVLIYKIYPTDLLVQFWIKNALDFSDSRCIIGHLPDVSTRWAFSYANPQREGDVLYELVCRAHISRHVEFYDKVIGRFPTAPLP
jgi:hypothetical protein